MDSGGGKMKIIGFSMALFLPGLLLLSGCSEVKQARPNFIVFLVDDLGSQDVGCEYTPINWTAR
jgi:hypothetical protein